MLIQSTALHFFVDGVCGAALAALVAKGLAAEEIEKYFMLYTIWAFGTQWLIGLAIDRYKRLQRCLLWLAFSLLFIGALGARDLSLKCFCLGIGNSIFHVLVGKIILERFAGFKEPGIFVSSGALGLALGLQQIIGVAIMLLGLFISCYLIYSQLTSSAQINEKAVRFRQVRLENPMSVLLSVLALCICVIFRGFTGTIRLDDMPLWLPCIYVLGKAVGGVCCDKFGYKHMLLALFLLEFVILQFAGLAPMLMFVLLCNMTMPLTLRVIYYYLPDYAGFTFGLAAVCLLPAWWFKDYFIPLPLMIILQFILLFIGGYLSFNKQPIVERSEE